MARTTLPRRPELRRCLALQTLFLRPHTVSLPTSRGATPSGLGARKPSPPRDSGESRDDRLARKPFKGRRAFRGGIDRVSGADGNPLRVTAARLPFLYGFVVVCRYELWRAYPAFVGLRRRPTTMSTNDRHDDSDRPPERIGRRQPDLARRARLVLGPCRGRPNRRRSGRAARRRGVRAEAAPATTGPTTTRGQPTPEARPRPTRATSTPTTSTPARRDHRDYDPDRLDGQRTLLSDDAAPYPSPRPPGGAPSRTANAPQSCVSASRRSPEPQQDDDHRRRRPREPGPPGQAGSPAAGAAPEQRRPPRRS